MSPAGCGRWAPLPLGHFSLHPDSGRQQGSCLSKGQQALGEGVLEVGASSSERGPERWARTWDVERRGHGQDTAFMRPLRPQCPRAVSGALGSPFVAAPPRPTPLTPAPPASYLAERTGPRWMLDAWEKPGGSPPPGGPLLRLAGLQQTARTQGGLRWGRGRWRGGLRWAGAGSQGVGRQKHVQWVGFLPGRAQRGRGLRGAAWMWPGVAQTRGDRTGGQGREQGTKTWKGGREKGHEWEL